MQPAPMLPHGSHPPNALPVEFALLLGCCSAPAASDDVRRALSPSLNWPRFLQLAEYHALIPQAHEALAKVEWLIPSAITAELRTRSLEAAKRSLWLTSELFRIVDALEASGIEVIAYKGPVLAQLLYGSVTSRQFGDIDLLVRRHDVAASISTIQQLGYATDFPRDANQNEWLSRGYEATFRSSYGRNLVELQWQLLPRLYAVDFKVEELFERSVHTTIGGRRYRTLCPEDLLLVLCVHAAKHNWERLGWLNDIASVVRSCNLDWIRINEEAERLGIRRVTAVSRLLCERLFQLTLPVNAAHDATARKIANDVVANLASGAANDFTSLSYYRTMLRAREHWSDRARFVVRLALRPSSHAGLASHGSSWLRLLCAVVPLFRALHKVTFPKSQPNQPHNSTNSPLTS